MVQADITSSGDFFIAAVNGQRVLDEIVATDAEKIDMTRQGIGSQRGGRHLNHDTTIELVALRYVLLAQFLPHLIQNATRLLRATPSRR